MDIVKKSVIDLVRDALEKERLEMSRLKTDNQELREENEILRKFLTAEQGKKVELELAARRKVVARESTLANFQGAKKVPVERRNGPVMPTNQKPPNVGQSVAPKMTSSDSQIDKSQPQMPANRAAAKSQPSFQHQNPPTHRLPASGQEQIRPFSVQPSQPPGPAFYDTRPTNYHAPVSSYQQVPRIPATYVVPNGHQSGYGHPGSAGVKQYENQPVNSRVQPVNPNRQATQPTQSQPSQAHPHSTYSSRPRKCLNFL